MTVSSCLTRWLRLGRRRRVGLVLLLAGTMLVASSSTAAVIQATQTFNEAEEAPVESEGKSPESESAGFTEFFGLRCRVSMIRAQRANQLAPQCSGLAKARTDRQQNSWIGPAVHFLQLNGTCSYLRC